MCSEKGDVQLYSPRDFSGVATPVRQVEKDGASTVHFVARHAGSPWDRRVDASANVSWALALHTPLIFSSKGTELFEGLRIQRHKGVN
jgi:hypothetical protein